VALPSVQFVQSVNLLTFRKEEFPFHKLHIIINAKNISLLFSNVLRRVQRSYGLYSSYGL